MSAPDLILPVGAVPDGENDGPLPGRIRGQFLARARLATDVTTRLLAQMDGLEGLARRWEARAEQARFQIEPPPISIYRKDEERSGIVEKMIDRLKEGGRNHLLADPGLPWPEPAIAPKHWVQVFTPTRARWTARIRQPSSRKTLTNRLNELRLETEFVERHQLHLQMLYADRIEQARAHFRVYVTVAPLAATELLDRRYLMPDAGEAPQRDLASLLDHEDVFGLLNDDRPKVRHRAMAFLEHLQ